MNDTSIPAKHDTGAQVNIVSEKHYNRLKKETKIASSDRKTERILPQSYSHQRQVHRDGERQRQETNDDLLCGTRKHTTTVERTDMREIGSSQSCPHTGENGTTNVGSGWAKAKHRLQ